MIKNENGKEFTISALITSYNDMRLIALVNELFNMPFDQIIVADGGSSKDLLQKLEQMENRKLKVFMLPGSVAETRYAVQGKLQSDIIVFIDTDEFPTNDWLYELVNPIIEGHVDFTFGPTKPFRVSSNRVTRFVDDYDEFYYSEIVPNDLSKGAMGNSAWSGKIFKNINFNKNLKMGGEDYDFTLKAMEKGFKGSFCSKAVLLHDQSSINTVSKLIRKRFNYMIGAAAAYRFNNKLIGSLRTPLKSNKGFKDPLNIILLILRPVALIFSFIMVQETSGYST